MTNETNIKVAKAHEERISRLYHDEKTGNYVICLNDGWQYNGIKNEITASSQKSVLRMIRGLEYVGETVEATEDWKAEMEAEATAVMMEEEVHQEAEEIEHHLVPMPGIERLAELKAEYSHEEVDPAECEHPEDDMTELEEKAYRPLPNYVKSLITLFQVHEKADRDAESGRLVNKYVVIFDGKHRVFTNYKAMVATMKKEAKEVG